MSIESLNAFSMDFFSLKGKTAIVTGGNSGLGQAFAMALAKAGANIFIPSFVKDNGETKEMIEKQGVEVDFMQVDITAKGAPQKIIAACCERFGTVDILVNNAGICKLNKVLDFGRCLLYTSSRWCFTRKWLRKKGALTLMIFALLLAIN